jgi:CysZ protein
MKYMAVPAIIVLFILIGIVFTAFHLGGDLGILILSWIPWEISGTSFLGLSNIIGYILFGLFGFVIFKYTLQVIAAPFMSLLSENLEKELTGEMVRSDGFNLKDFLHDLVRGARLAIRNLIRELFYVSLLFLLGLFPLIAVGTWLAIFLVQAFYAGFGNYDYALERHYDFKNSILFARRNKISCIVNGSVFLLILMIPVFGVIIALPLSTIAGTIHLVEIHNHEG